MKPKKEQQIHLNLNMMSDFRVISLSEEMGHEGISLYFQMYFFLYMQKECCHNLHKLELLAKIFKTDAETLTRVICDFELFSMAEDGTFSSTMLDEEMDITRPYTNCKVAKETASPAANVEAEASEKGVRKEVGKETSQTEKDAPKAGKATDAKAAKTTTPKAGKEAETIVEKAAKPACKSNKNTWKTDEKAAFQQAKSSDFGAVSTTSGNNNINIKYNQKEITTTSRPDNLKPTREWTECIHDAFAQTSWLEVVAMQSGMKMALAENLNFITHLFTRHVIAQGTELNITSDHEAKSYFMNFIRQGSPTRRDVDGKLKEYIRGKVQNKAYSPYEQYDPKTKQRSYDGVPIPADAPPRPNARVGWSYERSG